MRMRNANAQTHTPARERKSVEQMRVWARESHTPTHCNELQQVNVVEWKTQWLNMLVCILVASCIYHVFVGASYCKSTHNGVFVMRFLTTKHNCYQSTACTIIIAVKRQSTWQTSLSFSQQSIHVIDIKCLHEQKRPNLTFARLVCGWGAFYRYIEFRRCI